MKVKSTNLLIVCGVLLCGSVSFANDKATNKSNKNIELTADKAVQDKTVLDKTVRNKAVHNKPAPAQTNRSEIDRSETSRAEDLSKGTSQSQSQELSLELLTFLAEFSDDDGDVIDPETLDPITSDNNDHKNSSDQTPQQKASRQSTKHSTQITCNQHPSEAETNASESTQHNPQIKGKQLAKSQPDTQENVNTSDTGRRINTNINTDNNENSINCISDTVKQTARSKKETINDV
ncbi:hypothetical protein [Pleionea mediterranea]|uniref:hypothetical protein n=1 Tax=Pleionea mediterranea TaxID=523701 RepID=UPI0011B1D9B6|nr:hypothetical protein [Pleionea mediterranea]